MGKRNSHICLVFLIAILLAGCNFQVVPELGDEPEPVKTKFAGDYEPLQLRSMWAYCSQAFRLNSPYTPPELVAAMCDCYVDKMRETFNKRELQELSDNESRVMGQNLIKVCNVKSESVSI